MKGISSLVMPSLMLSSIIASSRRGAKTMAVLGFQPSFSARADILRTTPSSTSSSSTITSPRRISNPRHESRIASSSFGVSAVNQMVLFSTRASSLRQENEPTAKATTAPPTATATTAAQQSVAGASGNTRVKRAGSSSSSTNTGGLRRLPVIKAPNELMDRARKAPLRVKTDPTVQNVRARARKHGAESLTALTQALCLPLRDVVDGYKRELRRLHPFERVVADLTVRARQRRDGLTLEAMLGDIHEGRKMLLEAGKDWVHRAKHAETAREANDATREGTERMLELYRELAYDAVAGMVDLQRSLRSAPAVQLDTPAVVLVGAPNVGKSSIVRYISSATPEVNNYPFTTRGMTLGHVEVFWSDQDRVAGAVVPNDERTKRRAKEPSPDVVAGKYAFSQLCQVMDSPGILIRPEGEERNEMEELTLAAMKHLPTAVMYVMDLSGLAGDKCSSVKDQLQLRREIRARFPRRPWIDVISKIDLGIENEEETMAELKEILDGAPYIRLSVQEGEGIDELRTEVLRMLGEVRVVLDAMAAVDERSV